jgi:general secretion pathway protein F
MPVFEYQAIAKSTGKAIKGMIDAESPVAARRKLRDQALLPTEIRETFAKQRGGQTQPTGFVLGRVSVRDLSMMTRQMAVLLQAGMPLVQSLSALLDQTSNTRLRKTIFDVRDRVQSGATLADSLEAHGRVFSPLYVNMVRAGEAGGALEQILFRLADIQDHQAKMNAKIMSTMAYPAFMALFAVGVISFLMVVIVPRIQEIFTSQERALPRITEIMIGTSNFMRDYWLVLLGVLALVVMIWRIWIAREEGRLRWDRFLLNMPLFGQLRLKLVCARMSRTLGTMLQSGLTMMRALDVVTSVIQNKYVEKAMNDIKAGVRRGRDLAVPLKETGIFPPMLIHMVELGERSGELESMLIKVADTYDDDVRMTVDTLVGLLEPVIIVIMGIFVGFLVLAVLLPILNMTQNIG